MSNKDLNVVIEKFKEDKICHHQGGKYLEDGTRPRNRYLPNTLEYYDHADAKRIGERRYVKSKKLF